MHRLATWKMKLFAMLLSGVVALGLLWVAGNFITFNGETLNRKICLKAWFLRIRWFGRPKIGVAEPDSLLGWRHKPDAIGRHYVPYGFNVRDHIDGHGNRVTKAGYHLPKILFVGCSYTCGHGVADDSNYVALLQARLPGYKLINAGVNAYGTGQAYLRMLQMLVRFHDVRLVVYPFINQHAHRNYLRKSWLDLL